MCVCVCTHSHIVTHTPCAKSLEQNYMGRRYFLSQCAQQCAVTVCGVENTHTHTSVLTHTHTYTCPPLLAYIYATHTHTLTHIYRWLFCDHFTLKKVINAIMDIKKLSWSVCVRVCVCVCVCVCGHASCVCGHDESVVGKIVP